MLAHRTRCSRAVTAFWAVLALAPACVVGDEKGTEDVGDVDGAEVPDLEGPDEWQANAFATSEPDYRVGSCTYAEDCDFWERAGHTPRVCHNGGCWLRERTFHPGACTAHACWPDHWLTAQKRCEEEGFTRALSQQSWQVAGDIIWVGGWGYLDGWVGWHQVAIHGGRAMQRVTCQRDDNAPPKPAYVPPPPPPPPPKPSAPPVPAPGATVSFKTHLWPRLKANCSSCHAKNAEVSTSYARMTSTQQGGACNGRRLSIPGNASRSLVYQKITGTQSCGGSMAGHSNSTLRDILRRWINQGARNN